MIGTTLLIWTIGLSALDPVRKGMQPDELSFIVLGLVEVFAGVLLLTSVAPLVVKRLGKSKILTRRWGPVLPVSLAYPLATPVRTAVVMGMFSITVFSVIVLGGYAEQFDNYTSSFVEDAEGDYELLLTGSRSSPIELSENISDWNLSLMHESNIDSVARVHRGEVFLEDAEGERMPYVVRGFDEAFAYVSRLMKAQAGQLSWYDFDHWQRALAIDLESLQSQSAERVRTRPGTIEFLEYLQRTGAHAARPAGRSGWSARVADGGRGHVHRRRRAPCGAHARRRARARPARVLA